MEQKPASWGDLWNPAYADRMVFVDDPRDHRPGTVVGGQGSQHNYLTELMLSSRKVAELVKNIRIFDSDSPKSALIAGDGPG